MAASTESLLGLLAEVATTRRYPHDEATLSRLLTYVDLVLERGRHLNLTAARTREQAVDVLLASSLAVTCAVDVPPKCVVDLGTGNGLPGVAAALAFPEAEVVLVERRQKKAAAVADLVAAAGIGRTSVVACDGRELLRERPQLAEAVDLVTVRAVGPLDATTLEAAPWLAAGGRITHWKGRSLTESEIRSGRKAARRQGLVERPILMFEDDAGPGHLVTYERPPVA